MLWDTLDYTRLIQWQDPLTADYTFGYNNDFIAVIERHGDELLMWVNHEYPNPLLMKNQMMGNQEPSLRETIEFQRRTIGGSYFKVVRVDDQWQVVAKDPANGAVRADMSIPFAGGRSVLGSRTAMGTVANCAGGQTPWGTFLSCEENYDMFYGDRQSIDEPPSFARLGWNVEFQHPPEHYGWVVEINPATGHAQKHTSMGRFAHESATCVTTPTGNVVIYTADDKADEHLYKFIADPGTDLNQGMLYVADIERGQWLPLDWHNNPILQSAFESEMAMRIHTRKAAKLLGATPLNRPEDIAQHPITGAM